MANNWQIDMFAGLDQNQSRAKINSQIDKLKGQLKDVSLTAKIDTKKISDIQNQLTNLQVNLTNVKISDKALNDMVSQINNALKGIQIPNINIGGSNGGNILGNNVAKLEEFRKSLSNIGMSSTDIDTVAQRIENLGVKINSLNQSLSHTSGAKGDRNLLNIEVGGIDKFGQAVKLTQTWDMDLGQLVKDVDAVSSATRKAGTSTDTFAKQQSKAVANLTNQINQLNRAANDQNATRPITDSSHLSSLSTAYNDIISAIQRMGNASSDTFIAEQNNVKTLISDYKSLVSEFRNAENVATQMKSVDISSGIAQAQEKLGKLKANASGFEQMKQTIIDLDSAIAKVGDKSSLDAFINKLKVAESQLGRVKAEARTMATEQQRLSLANTIEAWNQKNTAATRAVREENERYVISLRDLNNQMTKIDFNKINTGFKQNENSMRALNRLGASLKNQWIQATQSFTMWLSASRLVMTVMTKLRQMPQTVKELDTSLVDLKKTTSMTTSQLEDFYYAANDVAKQMGVTTKEIIDQASAWSRLGYSSQEAATKMAKYSSMFASISPGMDVDTATNGLVSIMKAFDIGNDNPDDVLDGIMSKVNIIGNTAATSNAEIVNMLSKSSSAMKEANNTLEETIALETAAVEITRDDDSVGTAFKTLSMRIRGYDEETESYTNNVEELSGKIADLTKTASTPGGISLFTDASKTEFKSTYQLLSEISKVYDQLTDKNQAQLLEVLAGKRQGQIVAATINNFQAAEKAMDNMAKSAGNAEAEMSVIMDSLDYKLNKNKETWTGVAQNLFQREDMKSIVDAFTSIGEAVDFATDKLGLFGTIGLGAGLFAGIKNVGQAKMWACLIYAYPC